MRLVFSVDSEIGEMGDEDVRDKISGNRTDPALRKLTQTPKPSRAWVL